MISSGAALRAAARILRAERGEEPSALSVALSATIIVWEYEKEQKQGLRLVHVAGGSNERPTKFSGSV